MLIWYKTICVGSGCTAFDEKLNHKIPSVPETACTSGPIVIRSGLCLFLYTPTKSFSNLALKTNLDPIKKKRGNPSSVYAHWKGTHTYQHKTQPHWQAISTEGVWKEEYVCVYTHNLGCACLFTCKAMQADLRGSLSYPVRRPLLTLALRHVNTFCVYDQNIK